ncbi:unnamed protein product [Phytomonas sp. EM1]|nr:unnamed protein product [Phytomonas sp. EM1]|eukprot:CCW59805.1 unnamed protein product [Phytomonas sp. isolate EM1]
MQRNQSRATKGVAALRDAKQTEAAAILKFAKLISLDIDLERTRQLDLRNKEIHTLPLRLNTVLREVRKLDLSFNHITDVSPLSVLPHLSNLNLSRNPELRSLSGLGCKNLVVLSVAHCGLQFLSGLEDSSATLRTLIANDNELQLQSPSVSEGGKDPKPHLDSGNDVPIVTAAVENYKILASLKALETVVLSRNPQLCSLYSHDSKEANDKNKSPHKTDPLPHEHKADDQGVNSVQKEGEEEPCVNVARISTHPLSVFEELTHLAKLSLSECNISSLPSRWFLPMVTELRLVRNALTSMQPDGVILRSVKILDISYNRLESIATLRRCLFLRQISLKGNPLMDIYAQRDREERGESVEQESATMPEGQSREEHDIAKTVPRSLQRSLRGMLKHIQLIDGQPLLSSEELILKRPRPVKEVLGGEDGVTSAKEIDAKSLVAETTVPPKNKQRKDGAQKQNESNVKKITEELDEKDVVLDIPEIKETHAPIVRREKVHQLRKAGLIESGEAAVSTLLKQSKELGAW